MFFSLALTLSLSVFARPSTTDAVYEESLYLRYQNLIASPGLMGPTFETGLTPQEQKLFVDALWDLIENDENPLALEALNEIPSFHYQLLERLRIGILKIKYSGVQSLEEGLVTDLMNALLQPEIDTRLIYTIAAYEQELIERGHKELIELARTHSEYYDVIDAEAHREVTANIISDLFYNTPDTTAYMNGEYVKSIKIFMFCRENRLYPCLMIMKDIHDRPVRNEDGTLWTNPSLASSARGLPSYTRNGNTPMGIHTIDSVMPSADQQLSFGKFRRMILNFIPKSKGELLTKALLPKSSHDQDWWQPAVVARDAGRNLFRIHGTGRKNNDPTTPYYPFMRTSGCIAQRENTYDGITYKDQRELLDDIMRAMDMNPSYSNEVNIKGILYIMEIDNEQAPVDATDLALRGIE